MLGTCAGLCRAKVTNRPNVISKKLLSSVCKKPERKKKEVDNHKKAAVVLAGCGYLDGSSVHEASAVAVSLTKNNLMPLFFAPAICQPVVMDHVKACPINENRCLLQEAARIARGKIKPLSELRHSDVSCLIVPGGFGVAQSLSTYQKDKENCKIDSEMMRVLEEFHDVKKPMGFMCIAAILPAKMFSCVKITFGMKGNSPKWPYQDAIEAATEMGADVENRRVDEFSFDKQHMVFSTPAFMYAGMYHEIFEGISRMIENMCPYIE